MFERIEELEAIRRSLESDKFDVNASVDPEGNSPLHVASSLGDFELIDKLVEARANLYATNKEGLTPIAIAFAAGNMGAVERLLEAGVDLNKPCTVEEDFPIHIMCALGNDQAVREYIKMGADVNVSNSSQLTPLHLAVDRGNIKLVTLLLKAGANTDAKDLDEKTAFDFALEDEKVECVRDIMAKMLGHGMDVNTILDKDKKENALHIAARFGIEKIVSYLSAKEINFMQANIDGQYPLIIAVKEGHAACVDILLKKLEIDVNEILNNDGGTLLHTVATSGDTETFKALLNGGANPFLENDNGETPAGLAVARRNIDMMKAILDTVTDVNQSVDTKLSALLKQAIVSRNAQMVELVLDRGADPNLSFADNPKPLLVAAAYGAVSIVSQLLARGAEIDARNQDDGFTALHYAVYDNSIPMMNELLKYKLNLNLLNSDGCTPLHMAVIEGRDKSVAVLIDAGADINLPMKNGQTLLHLALENDDRDLVVDLINRGANINAPDSRGVTPLQLASSLNYPNLTSVFLHKGMTAPESVRDIQSYLNFTLGQKSGNSDNQHIIDQKILSLNADLYNVLSTNGSPMIKALAEMTENEKAKLLSALITNDTAYLKKCFQKTELSDFLKDNGYTPDDLKYIAQHYDVASDVLGNEWLSASAKLLIDVLLSSDGKQPLSVDAQVHIVTVAMSTIPENIVSLRAKYLIAMDISSTISSDFTDIRVAYNEFQQPLSGGKSSGLITDTQYQKMMLLDKTTLTQSDFIMLTTGLLQKYAVYHPKIGASLNDVRQKYTNGDFKGAVSALVGLAAANPGVITEGIGNCIRISAGKFTSADIPNYGRRFFENRIASLTQGMAPHLISTNRILSHFGISEALTATDAAKKISLLGEAQLSDCLDRTEQIKAQSDAYRSGRRVNKVGFHAKQEEAADNTFSDSVFSSNTGVMTSNQPNYYDERSQNPLRNSTVDIYRSNFKGDAMQLFQHGAFASGVSGHTFFMIAVLEKYASENSTSPTLNEDINRFMQSFMATYVGRGYHGLLEMTTILQEPAVKSMFKPYGVQLTGTFDHDVLEAAFKDTQTYTATLVARSLVHAQLQQPRPEAPHKYPKPEIKTANSVLDIMKQLNPDNARDSLASS
jgi:ankyrin repeat protein